MVESAKAYDWIILRALLVFCFSIYAFADSVYRDHNNSMWQILTDNNFSSQIRTHSHSLLFVTVPWCGESRALMKEITNQVANNQDKFGLIKLMVLYRNNDKMISDLLGATEGISIFFYHHSTPYKFRGRLRTQNILTSLNHMMSLQPNELPLKPLGTEEELDAFLQSTDKAVLLLEFCGWSRKLMHKSKVDERGSGYHAQYVLDNGGLHGENLSSGAHETIPFGEKENQKNLKIEKLTCGVKDELYGNGIPWLHGFNWANDTYTSQEDTDIGDGDCTPEKYQQFESFFSKFLTIVREHFLPPERQRYGLVFERSLLSYLGIKSLDTWSLMVHFAGCPNCSKIIDKQDDIKSALLVPHSLALELENEGNSFEPALPGNKPSIVLFVDRSSQSSRVRKKSKLALELFRKLSLSYQTVEQNGITSEDISKGVLPMRSKSILDQPARLPEQPSPAHKVVRYKDKMAYVIINEGANIAVDNMDGGSQGSSIQEVLDLLLKLKNPASSMKEVKVSSLAKEVGFQLLSDDFEVKMVNKLPTLEERDQPERASTGKAADPSLASMVEDGAHLNSGDLSSATIVPEGSETQPKPVDVETSVQNDQENAAYNEGNTQLFHTESTEEAKNVEQDAAYRMSFDEKGHRSNVDGEGPFTNSSQQSSFLEQDRHSPKASSVDENSHKDLTHHSEHGLSNIDSNGDSKGIVSDSLETIVISNVVSQLTHSSQTVDEGKEHQVQYRTFRGSFYFYDGGYRLLASLTSGSKIPSAGILDPVLQKHYVFPDETLLSYPSLANFLDGYLNGSLPSYQRVQPVVVRPREAPQPPFVNLDFRESDSFPQVTLGTFSEMVIGFNKCDKGYTMACLDSKNIGPAWKKDVLVLFSNTWCGFCQRMELVVREVYRACKGYMSMTNRESNTRKSTTLQDKTEDVILNELPAIYRMDCTLNDCGELLQSMGQREDYPALMLFPAEKKDAILYQGDVSVSHIVEFIAALGSKSFHLIGNKGILWPGSGKEYRSMDTLMREASSDPVNKRTHANEGEFYEILNSKRKLSDKTSQSKSHKSSGVSEENQQVSVGSFLIATDKLLHAPPFDNSSILIVKAGQAEGFQGLITNKQMEWNFLKGIDEESAALKQAPLSFGGPVIVRNMPLVSLARRATEVGYSEIMPNFYYGDQMATLQTIEGIKFGNLSAFDYWFFLGYSSWGWNQLFTELAQGAWRISTMQIEQLEWPESSLSLRRVKA